MMETRGTRNQSVPVFKNRKWIAPNIWVVLKTLMGLIIGQRQIDSGRRAGTEVQKFVTFCMGTLVPACFYFSQQFLKRPYCFNQMESFFLRNLAGVGATQTSCSQSTLLGNGLKERKQTRAPPPGTQNRSENIPESMISKVFFFCKFLLLSRY